METVNRLRVFVAATSDMQNEVAQIESAIEILNKQLSGDAAFTLHMDHYKTDVTPAIGSDAQAVVNDQIGRDWDIFVGLVGHRAGSETPRAASGLAEEVAYAVERSSSLPSKAFQVFNRKIALSLDDIDTDQLVDAKKILQCARDAGAFTSAFASPADLHSQVLVSIAAAVSEYKKAQIAPIASTSPSGSDVARLGLLQSPDTSNEADELLGILELQDSASDKLDEFAKLAGSFQSETEMLSSNIATHLEELQSIEIQDDKRRGRAIIDNFALDLSIYAKQTASLASDMRDTGRDALREIAQSVSMFIEDVEDVDIGELMTLRTTMAESQLAIDEASTIITEFDSTIGALPRLTTKLMRAKDKARESLRTLLGAMDSYREETQNLLSTIDRVLGE